MLAVAAALSSGACQASSSARSNPPIFEGEGGIADVIQAEPASSEAAVWSDAGPCGQPLPPGEHRVIDDFEDGDQQAFKAFEREGWWWSTSDGTQGATLHPPSTQFLPERLPDGDRLVESEFAAHMAAAGQTSWGAAWGTTLRWVRDGVKCPFNASNFAGVRFMARGEGEIRIQVPVPMTVPATEEMGECESKCWDLHSKVVRLDAEWTELVIPFEKLQQGGWGVDARLDVARLLGVQFSATPSEVPVDFWIDELEFVTPEQLAAWRHAGPRRGATTAALDAEDRGSNI